MINQDFLNKLAPVELQFLRASITKLCQEKILPETTNYENFTGRLEVCPKCGSVHIVKNGFNPNHKQKYRCKDCKAVFMATTGTMFTHSRSSFDQWASFIACELNGLTLQQEAVATALSVTTCFHMRHKLYQAASKIQKAVVLKGNVEVDPSYTKINLKGTKKENMPRYSKRRGRSKPGPYSKHLQGISHHKVCIMTAIDEYDNILFKIAGLGEESIDKLEIFKDSFAKANLIISDDKPCIKNFAKMIGVKADVIPSTGGKKRYLTNNGNSIAAVNELHTEAKDLIRHKRGVSTRHFQGYLDWIVFKKHLKYTLEMKKWKSSAYMETMAEQIPFTNKQITKITMPIDLYAAYGEYHYGIFALIN